MHILVHSLCFSAPEATVILPGHYRCKTELPPLEASKKHPEKTTLFSFAQVKRGDWYIANSSICFLRGDFSQIVQTLHELGHTVHFFYYHQALLQQPNNGLAVNIFFKNNKKNFLHTNPYCQSFEMYTDINETFSQLTE